MKRPILIILGAAAGALLIAGIGASAHNALSPAHQVVLTNAGTETPEPTDKPEAAATAEPTEAPQAPTAAEAADTDNETNDEGAAPTKTTTVPAPAQLDSGVMQGGGRESSGGGRGA
jgi:hypothetical protein